MYRSNFHNFYFFQVDFCARMETTRILLSFCFVTVILAAGVVGKWILTNFLLTSSFYCKYLFQWSVQNFDSKIAWSRRHLLSKELPWFIQSLNFNFLITFFDKCDFKLFRNILIFDIHMYIKTKKQILIYLEKQKNCICKEKYELSISL